MLGRMGRHADSAWPGNDGPFAEGRILVVALSGWNDAGEAASDAVAELQRASDVTRMIDLIDDEEYFDYSIHRPRIARDEHGRRRFEWPATTLFGRPLEQPGRDVLVLTGPEPTLKWRSYAERVMSLCERERVTRLVVVGALLADAPHTRPIQVHASSEDALAQQELKVGRSEYSGPTGVLSVLADVAHRRGIRVVSLWASVPHYAHHAPSPKAVLALTDRLMEVLDVPIPREQLVQAAVEWVAEVDGALAEEGEIGEYVRFLERAYDTVEAPEASGEAIAKEFERFLQRDAEQHGPGKPGSQPGPPGPPGSPGSPGQHGRWRGDREADEGDAAPPE